MAQPYKGPRTYVGCKLPDVLVTAARARAAECGLSVTDIVGAALAAALAVPYTAGQASPLLTTCVDDAADTASPHRTLARTTRGVPPADVSAGIEHHRRTAGVTRGAWVIAALRHAIAHPEAVTQTLAAETAAARPAAANQGSRKEAQLDIPA